MSLRGLASSVATLGLAGVGGLVGALAPAAAPARAEDAKRALPLVGRPIVRANEGDPPYVVDGHQVIPKGSIVRVEQNVKIVGTNGASLEVLGGLEVHGVQGRRVEITGVDFSKSLAPVEGLHFDNVTMMACTFATGEAVFEGGLTVENATLRDGCRLDVSIRNGFVRLLGADVRGPCGVRGVEGKGKAPVLSVIGCYMGPMTLRGPTDATVRNSEVQRIDASDFTSLTIDGCDLVGDVTLKQTAGASFGKLQMLKCNLLGASKVVLDGRGKAESVRFDKWFFEGENGAAQLTDAAIGGRIADSADDPEVKVRAVWTQPQDRRHRFVTSRK